VRGDARRAAGGVDVARPLRPRARDPLRRRLLLLHLLQLQLLLLPAQYRTHLLKFCQLVNLFNS